MVYSFVYHFCRAPEQKKYECYERDNILVDTSEVFEGHCEDKTGEIIEILEWFVAIHNVCEIGELYKDGDIKNSCCQCIRQGRQEISKV